VKVILNNWKNFEEEGILLILVGGGDWFLMAVKGEGGYHKEQGWLCRGKHRLVVYSF